MQNVEPQKKIAKLDPNPSNPPSVQQRKVMVNAAGQKRKLDEAGEGESVGRKKSRTEEDMGDGTGSTEIVQTGEREVTVGAGETQSDSGKLHSGEKSLIVQDNHVTEDSKVNEQTKVDSTKKDSCCSEVKQSETCTLESEKSLSNENEIGKTSEPDAVINDKDEGTKTTDVKTSVPAVSDSNVSKQADDEEDVTTAERQKRTRSLRKRKHPDTNIKPLVEPLAKRLAYFMKQNDRWQPQYFLP